MYDEWYLERLTSADDKHASNHEIHTFEIERVPRKLHIGTLQENEISDWLKADGKDFLVQAL